MLATVAILRDSHSFTCGHSILGFVVAVTFCRGVLRPELSDLTRFAEEGCTKPEAVLGHICREILLRDALVHRRHVEFPGLLRGAASPRARFVGFT